MTKDEMSCIDCAITNCIAMDKKFPDFCPTINKVEEKDKQEVLELYSLEENKKSMIAAAEVEYEGYGKLTRVEEIMEYAKKINAKKLGIATCVGLINEARILAKIFKDVEKIKEWDEGL